MGSGFSSANNVFVYTDRPFYHSGDTISGYVLLNCVEPFECKRVMLKVEGYEKVSWEEKRDDSSYDNEKEEWISNEQYIPYTGYKEFFKSEVSLHDWPQKCQPGQYQFPFSFVLPRGLPGTFEYNDTQHTYAGTYYNYTNAKVKYTVEAVCEVPGMFKANVKHENDLTVHQQLAKPPSEIKAHHSQSVTSCCCMGQGNTSITAHVQKDSYVPGETACLLIEVDNSSAAEFSSIEVKLRRSVTLTAGGAIQKQDDELAKQSYPGVQPQTSFLGSEAKGLTISLPLDLLPSTMGHVIECEYNLVVILKASAFVSDVELKVPVLIYIPAPQHTTYTQPPSWWTPTVVAPPVQLALPSAPPMPPKAQAMEGSYDAPQPVFAGPN